MMGTIQTAHHHGPGQEELITGKEHVLHANKPSGLLRFVRMPSSVAIEGKRMLRSCDEN